MTTASDIGDRIVAAVLTKKLAPGARLGEQQLATLFGCSRTIVREALARLSTRGIVNVSARRGWYLAEPSEDEAREAFEARRVVETGLLRCAKVPDKTTIKRLRMHLGRQRAAVRGNDIGLRSFLLGDFHVCLAECMGNVLLTQILRDLTARTTLIAMQEQSAQNAAASCAEHARIVEALSVGDLAQAEQLLGEHLGTWRDKLPIQAGPDPLVELRQALLPAASHPLASRPTGRSARPRAAHTDSSIDNGDLR